MKNRKNILIVSPGKIALTETFIRAHIERLNGSVRHLYGYDLKYFTDQDLPLEDSYSEKAGFGFKLLSLLPHFLYFKILQRRRNDLKRFPYIKRYLKDNNIDVVLAEYGIAGSFITDICEDLKIPLIVHFHGYDASRHDILEKYRDGYQRMFNYASKVIAVSKAMREALIIQGCRPEKIIINTYGPHPDYLEINPAYQSDQIVAVGRQTFKKAPYLTILAFKKVLKSNPSLKLLIIGDGLLLELCKNLVKSLDLSNNIKFTGALKRSEIIDQIEKSCLMIQHSIVAHDGDSEGTPVGIIEAMAAGLPVVSTKHAGIPDVVIDGTTGYLVQEGDINNMALKIKSLMENREICRQMGEKGKARIQKEFTLEKHIALLDGIINEVLN